MSKAHPKSKSKTKAVVPRYRPNGPSLFGPPPLLVGEDAAQYDELFAAIRAVLNPIDTVDEMFVADVVFSAWEVLRWRRLKSSLIRGDQTKALEEFLSEELKVHYSLYKQDFASKLASTLQANFPEDQADAAQQLADACARDEPDANDKVNTILADTHLDIDDIDNIVRKRKAEDLAQKYVRRDSHAVTLVDKILTGASADIDALTVKNLTDRLDAIGLIDRLAHIAEDRRNTSLREIDRRRPLLGESLRRGVEEVEDAEFQVLTTPTKGKH